MLLRSLTKHVQDQNWFAVATSDSLKTMNFAGTWPDGRL
jgi:hypothetical protein